MSEKPCVKCGVVQPLLMFPKKKYSLDGTAGRCIACAKEAAKESVRRYRQKNLEKIRAHQREMYHSNIEKSRELHRAKYYANKERRAESARRWAKANMDKRRALDRAWRAANPEYNKKKLAEKRQRLRNLSEFDRFVLYQASELCELRRLLCGNAWQIDHIIPVALGGTSEYTNIQVVPAIWNASKGARHSEKFFGKG